MSNVAKNITRVLVVDDSLFMRKVISDILNSDDLIEVIDIAKNGNEAIEKAKSLNPDVITLDIEMPEKDGLTCLKELLAIKYIPVVMLSGLTKEGAEDTIKALSEGAVDFITKPTNIFDMSGDSKKYELIEKVKIAKYTTRSQRDVNRVIRIQPKSEIVKSSEIKNIIAIGTSTGGPRALQDVIPFIPGGIPAAFLVVQHMPAGFTKSLAERLNGMSEVVVKEAEHNELIKPGYVYIAPGDYHMLVERNLRREVIIKLTQSPPVGSHRPAVNVMLESLSETGLTNLVGVIMTGMGGDGSEGLKKIKNINKAYIIAQDEASCTVFGMPKVAIQTGVVDAIIPLKEISKEIMKIVGVQI
jgi:two-component system, chemotaxis family, protein-glutamate methylesterase/glutaminase